MGTKIVGIEMDAPADVRDGIATHRCLELLAAWSRTWLRPQEIAVGTEDGRAHLWHHRAGGADAPPFSPWRGESIVDGQALTPWSEPDGGDDDLIAVAAAALGDARIVSMDVQGALRHIAPGQTEPGWYGHWDTRDWHSGTRGLWELVRLELRRHEHAPLLWIRFSVSGYPLMALRPHAAGGWHRGDPALAARNRALLLPRIAEAPGWLGLDPAQIAWTFATDGGDMPMYARDATMLRERWLPAFEAGQADRPDIEPPSQIVATITEAEAEQLEARLSGPIEEQALTLRVLARSPTGHWRIRLLLDERFHSGRASDDEPVLLQVPFLYGPLRLLVGAALAAENHAVGDEQEALSDQVPQPLTARQIERLEREYQLAPLEAPSDLEAPHAGPLGAYRRLDAEGAIPRVELAYSHPMVFSFAAEPDEPAP